MPSDSEVRSFFEGQTVFITGGGGFIGKILIEKLLRECDVSKIYVLMRPKKDKTAEERFDNLFSYPCFDGLKSKNMESLKKVFLINGDCQEPSLGMSQQDIRILIDETTSIIHAAASVKFDQPLKEGAYTVRSTRDLLELSKQMTKLKVFVYVSTVFSNCMSLHIKEEFCEPPMSPENLLSVVDSLDDTTLKAITPNLLGDWPNTYLYTKSIAEDLVRAASGEVPVVVVRPGIITSSAEEPLPGWIDNMYGLVGISVGGGLGVLRSLHAKLDANTALIPADYVANCILAASWKREKSGNTAVYNVVASQENHLTWSQVQSQLETHAWATPPSKTLWYYTFKIRESKFWHTFAIFFYHTVIAYVVDLILRCLGRPTIAVKAYQRLNPILDSVSFFTTRNWNVDYRNVVNLWDELNEEDKKLFNFDIASISWDSYIRSCVLGIRLHLLKESMDTLPQARRRARLLFVVHYTLVAFFYFIVYKLLARLFF